MAILGLTGNIGSGKTTALKTFKKQGAKTVSADEIVKKLYKEKKTIEKIKKIFNITSKQKEKIGKTVKKISKKQIAKIIFSNSKKRKQLEKTIHPLVLKKIKEEIKKFNKANKQQKQNKKNRINLLVVEVPLLFEAKWNAEKLFDKIIVVEASEKNRMQRSKKYSIDEFFDREKNQIPPKRKIKFADFAINNNKTKKEIEKRVKKIIEKLQ